MSTILSEAPEAVSPAGARQSAGAWLRAARQAQGLHIAVLAAQLKVPQAKLEALEADRHEELPDATFARALAKAMCRVLKIDAAPVLELLPRGADPALERVSRGLNQPFRERALREEPVSLEWLKRPMVWAPLLLLLAALAVYLLPGEWLTPLSGPEAAKSNQVEIQPAPAPQLDAASAPAAAEQPAAASVPAIAAPTVPAAPATVAASVAAISVPASVVVPTSPAPLQAGQVPMRVKAVQESWVEVTDAQGQVMLSRLMRPGDVAEMAVLPPLRLRIGNVAGTEITLRGAAVDLASQSRDNVARLELK